MTNPKPFDELFADLRDKIGSALQTKMAVERRDFRSLAAELDMPPMALNNIALGTQGKVRCVPNFERHMRVAHWLGLLETAEDQPSELFDLMPIIARMDLPKRKLAMIERVLVAILREELT